MKLWIAFFMLLVSSWSSALPHPLTGTYQGNGEWMKIDERGRVQSSLRAYFYANGTSSPIQFSRPLLWDAPYGIWSGRGHFVFRFVYLLGVAFCSYSTEFQGSFDPATGLFDVTLVHPTHFGVNALGQCDSAGVGTSRYVFQKDASFPSQSHFFDKNFDAHSP